MVSIVFLIIKSIVYAAIGLSLRLMMNGTRDILHFIPSYVEGRFGANSAAYHLTTCPKCLAGQAALWIGLPNLGKFGLEFYVGTIALAIIIAHLTEKKVLYA